MGGTITVDQHNVTVSAGDCVVSETVLEPNLAGTGAFVAGACTRGKEIGTATVLFGATNTLADGLANAFSNVNGTSGFKQYVISCAVDIAPAFAFRPIRFEGLPLTAQFQTGYTSAYQVTGDPDSSCSPSGHAYGIGGPANTSQQHTFDVTSLTTQAALAVGASATWPYTNRAYANGATEIFWLPQQMGRAFNDSTNDFEDFLGRITAVTMGEFWGDVGGDRIAYPGTTQFTGERVGPGGWLALLCVVPSLFSVCMLVWLLWQNLVKTTTRTP